MGSLTDEHCEPCEGGVDPMAVDEAKEHLGKVEDWDLVDVPKITKQYNFADFEKAIEFVNEIAEISEQENHHPSIEIDYNTVDITIWTHAIDGLSRNDFILAAKFDEAASKF